MKLTDTQLVILQSGARASDRLCLADAKLGAAPRAAIAKKLVSLGLAEAAPCPPTMPPAHRFPSSAKAGAKPMTLRITDAGLGAIGVEPEGEEPVPAYDSEEERAMQRAAIVEREIAAEEQAQPAKPDTTVGISDPALGEHPIARENRASWDRPTRHAKAAKPGSGRAFWAAAEEAASRGELPPEPDFSAPTHAPYRKKLQRMVVFAQLGDVASLRAVKINPTSTTPKALARWRDLAVRAIEAREAGR